MDNSNQYILQNLKLNEFFCKRKPKRKGNNIDTTTIPIMVMNGFRGMAEQRKALHRKSLIKHEQDLNMRRSCVKALLNRVVQ